MDRIFVNFVKFLSNPFIDIPDKIVNEFNSNKEIKIVFFNILNRNLDKLSPYDFEKISDNYDFLANCTHALATYGFSNDDKTFMELALEILKLSRKYLEEFT